MNLPPCEADGENPLAFIHPDLTSQGLLQHRDQSDLKLTVGERKIQKEKQHQDGIEGVSEDQENLPPLKRKDL